MLKEKFPLIILRKLYHRWWARTEFREVPLSICITFTGFPFAEPGWHHLRLFCQEVDANPNLSLEESILYRFHERYRPEGMFELVRHRGNHIQFRPALGIFPWGSLWGRYVGVGPDGTLQKDWARSRFCGPTPRDVMQAEFDRMLATYCSLKAYGYQSWKKGFVGGTLLQRRDGKQRYIVLQGNHRTAMLAHLEYTSIVTSPVPGCYRIIDERDVESWHYVKTGECSVSDALAYFHAFFEVTGYEQAERFGLLPESGCAASTG